MSFKHEPSIKPTASQIELGRGADGIVVEIYQKGEKCGGREKRKKKI